MNGEDGCFVCVLPSKIVHQSIEVATWKTAAHQSADDVFQHATKSMYVLMPKWVNTCNFERKRSKWYERFSLPVDWCSVNEGEVFLVRNLNHKLDIWPANSRIFKCRCQRKNTSEKKTRGVNKFYLKATIDGCLLFKQTWLVMKSWLLVFVWAGIGVCGVQVNVWMLYEWMPVSKVHPFLCAYQAQNNLWHVQRLNVFTVY